MTEKMRNDDIARGRLLWKAVDSAVPDEDAAVRLVNEGAAFTAENDMCSVFKAAERGMSRVVMAAVGRGFPVDAPSVFGEMLLARGVSRNDGVLVDSLLTAGADPNAENGNGTSGLKMAIALCHKGFYRRMVLEGADLLHKGHKEKTPLAVAVQHRNVRPENREMLRLVLDDTRQQVFSRSAARIEKALTLPAGKKAGVKLTLRKTMGGAA